jgi:hypothetical protein
MDEKISLLELVERVKKLEADVAELKRRLTPGGGIGIAAPENVPLRPPRQTIK